MLFCCVENGIFFFHKFLIDTKVDSIDEWKQGLIVCDAHDEYYNELLVNLYLCKNCQNNGVKMKNYESIIERNLDGKTENKFNDMYSDLFYEYRNLSPSE